MPDYERNGKKGDPPQGLTAAPKMRVSEPRCHICNHKQREYIDRLLAMQTPYSQIERLFETDSNPVERRSLSNHAQRHLSMEDEAVRKIIQAEAQSSDTNIEEGVSALLNRRTYADIAIRKGLEALISGQQEVEPKDVAKLIEIREKMDQGHNETAKEEIMVQFYAFKQAVDELAEPSLKFKILARMRELLGREVDAAPALQPAQDGTAQPPETSDTLNQ